MYVPVPVGVPDSAPFGAIVTPGGSEPLTRAKLYGVIAPEAAVTTLEILGGFVVGTAAGYLSSGRFVVTTPQISSACHATVCASFDRQVSWLNALLTLIVALGIQIGTNYVKAMAAPGAPPAALYPVQRGLTSAMKDAGKAVMRAVGSEADPREMDLLDTLKIEHDEVRTLLSELQDASSSARRKALVRAIRLALLPHAKAEERVLYAAIIKLRDRDAQTDGHEGNTEHGLAARTLQHRAVRTGPPRANHCSLRPRQ